MDHPCSRQWHEKKGRMNKTLVIITSGTRYWVGIHRAAEQTTDLGWAWNYMDDGLKSPTWRSRGLAGEPWTISYYSEESAYRVNGEIVSIVTNKPVTPVLISPLNEDVLSKTQEITLMASPFSDPDDHTLYGTSWQIKANNDTVVHFSEEMWPNSKEYLNIPAGTLLPGLKYLWKVRYADSNGDISEWSEESTFKVGTSVPESLPEIPAGIKLEDFGMISIVHWPDNPSPTAVFNIDYNARYCKFGTYDPITGSYIEYGENIEMEPGKAYWVLTRELRWRVSRKHIMFL